MLMPSLARALYSTLIYLAQPLLRYKLRRRAVAEPGYGLAVEERFGHYGNHHSAATPEQDAKAGWIWIHAVSLGETRAAAILLTALRQQRPHLRLLLTHSTATGRTEGQKLLQPGDRQVWLPWDTPGAVQRFLRRFRPMLGILLETEIWPNLIAMCQQHHVPLVLANARLNEKSYQQARRLGWLARPAYAGLTAVYAQSDADAKRLCALGAPVQGVFGNLKFDAIPDAAQITQGRLWRSHINKPVLLLASSREGEEELWLQAWQTWAAQAQTHRNVQWLIVPRHPQRFDAVATVLEQAGLRVSRRSQWKDYPEPADVWIGDTIGEMAFYYSLATVALLGGSFAPLGGQNLIEAVACGCPLVLGPHTFNFAEAATLALRQEVARPAADMAQAIVIAETWIQEGALLEKAQAAALLLSQEHRGAAQATATAVESILSKVG